MSFDRLHCENMATPVQSNKKSIRENNVSSLDGRKRGKKSSRKRSKPGNRRSWSSNKSVSSLDSMLSGDSTNDTKPVRPGRRKSLTKDEKDQMIEDESKVIPFTRQSSRQSISVGSLEKHELGSRSCNLYKDDDKLGHRSSNHSYASIAFNFDDEDSEDDTDSIIDGNIIVDLDENSKRNLFSTARMGDSTNTFGSWLDFDDDVENENGGKSIIDAITSAMDNASIFDIDDVEGGLDITRSCRQTTMKEFVCKRSLSPDTDTTWSSRDSTPASCTRSPRKRSSRVAPIQVNSNGQRFNESESKAKTCSSNSIVLSSITVLLGYAFLVLCTFFLSDSNKEMYTRNVQQTQYRKTQFRRLRSGSALEERVLQTPQLAVNADF